MASNVVNTKAKKKKDVWNKEEDEALISSFMNINTSAIVGTNQKKPMFWRDVHALFREAHEQRPCDIRVRTEQMLKGRWKRLLLRVNIFVGIYDEAKRTVEKMSVRNDHDVLQTVVTLFESENGPWNMDHAWKMLRKYPKWQEYAKVARGDILKKSCSGKGITKFGSVPTPSHAMESEPDSTGSGKRFKLNDGGYSTQGSDDGAGELKSFIRPDENKKAKEKAHAANRGGSSGGSGSDAAQLVLDAFKERITLYQTAKLEAEERKRELAREKLEYFRKKEERVVASENRALLMKFIEKEIAMGLTEEEATIKAKLMKQVGMA